MFDINKHEFYLISVLKDIYSDIELATTLQLLKMYQKFPLLS